MTIPSAAFGSAGKTVLITGGGAAIGLASARLSVAQASASLSRDGGKKRCWTRVSNWSPWPSQTGVDAHGAVSATKRAKNGKPLWLPKWDRLHNEGGKKYSLTAPGDWYPNHYFTFSHTD